MKGKKGKKRKVKEGKKRVERKNEEGQIENEIV